MMSAEAQHSPDLLEPRPETVVLDPAAPLEGLFVCERGDCLACAGLNFAMALFVRYCQHEARWAPFGKEAMGVMMTNVLNGVTPECLWAQLPWWPDYYGLVEKRMLAWRQDKETLELALVITPHGLARLREWIGTQAPKNVH